jgi:hypothetical protein
MGQSLFSQFERRAPTRVPNGSCPKCAAAPRLVTVAARTSRLLYFRCLECGKLWSVETPTHFTPLWSLQKGAIRVDVELRTQGEHDGEIQLIRNGEFYAGRRFHLRADAMAYSQQLRHALEASGWRPPN